MMYKLKLVWKVLTKDDWVIVNKNPPERPFTMALDGMVVYFPPLEDMGENND